MRFEYLAAVVAASLLLTAPALAQGQSPNLGPAVGPQYDTAHVYVAPTGLERLSTAFTATAALRAGEDLMRRRWSFRRLSA
jgi:hypothetical protein